MTTTPQRPEVDDPRVLALAKARQHIAHSSVFNVVCPPWDGLTAKEQHLSLLDARNYLHAALDARLVPAAVPPTGQTDAPHLAIALITWRSWWDGYDTWEGSASYLDLDTAKAHTARDYAAEEYGEPEEDDGPDQRPDFTWVQEHGSWNLLDHGKATSVQIFGQPIYRPATEREIKQEQALRAAEEADRATRQRQATGA